MSCCLPTPGTPLALTMPRLAQALWKITALKSRDHLRKSPRPRFMCCSEITEQLSIICAASVRSPAAPTGRPHKRFALPRSVAFNPVMSAGPVADCPRVFLFPGLSHNPRSDKSEISFSVSKPNTYKKYIDNIDTLLKLYDDGRQADPMKYEDCGGKWNTES